MLKNKKFKSYIHTYIVSPYKNKEELKVKKEAGLGSLYTILTKEKRFGPQGQ